MAWNEETRLTVPKTKFEFSDDFEKHKHALSNGPMHKAMRSSDRNLTHFISRLFLFRTDPSQRNAIFSKS